MHHACETTERVLLRVHGLIGGAAVAQAQPTQSVVELPVRRPWWLITALPARATCGQPLSLRLVIWDWL